MSGGEDLSGPVIILDRSEFDNEMDYEKAIEQWLREKKNPPLRYNHPRFPMITRDDVP